MEKGEIKIVKKQDTEPLRPRNLLELLPYRVITVFDNYKDVSIDDIVLKIPGGYSTYILNCTQQKMLTPGRDDWKQEFTCKRAHDIQSVIFVYDNDHA